MQKHEAQLNSKSRIFICCDLNYRFSFSEMNENSLPVITGKKQKIDLNDLQNVSQYLANHEQVSNEHEMEGVMLCGESLVGAIYVVSPCIFTWLEMMTKPLRSCMSVLANDRFLSRVLILAYHFLSHNIRICSLLTCSTLYLCCYFSVERGLATREGILIIWFEAMSLM